MARYQISYLIPTMYYINCGCSTDNYNRRNIQHSTIQLLAQQLKNEKKATKLGGYVTLGCIKQFSNAKLAVTRTYERRQLILGGKTK